MQVFIAQIINGLSLGSIYVLLATGFNLLLLVALIIHFSYPVVVVFSMYIVWVVLNATGNNLLLGILAGVVSSILLNVISAPIFQKVMQKRGEVDVNSTMVVSMGMGFIITDILSHSFNHGFPIAYPEAITGGGPLFRIGLISVQVGQVWSLVIGAVAVSAFFVLLYKTRAGRAFRAIAEDPAGARLVGIPLVKTGIQSYALSGIMGGMSAILIAMLLHSASPGLGDMLAHKVLAVSIVAGLGNLVGGLVVGLALGVLEALIQGYAAGSWSNAIAFVVMLVVILWKPKGLFGIKV
ncbi:MAG: branched-chain amino acid ABC transporter permease [Spirochaetia bacterium]|jgi:branched-chain amino acid transport system permease protein|uniref:High-affinity branched-chain amino acid transport system permease protein LivH n=2 Tax=root TaxID=1 RepID=A0A644V3C2_9ZZZZ|nr:branched-chain amino acid ABC transporter permease [Spirochaetia bacterium]NLX45032.1 branched-chain amino acid ABC transporter permease [Treponema sp.]VBB41265.1 putative inner-membrane translocator [uncultured Spirochaetota bacterium]HOI22599.1 branched-chain amino acid ABC transporter permease [Spirochaetales bacterium]